MQSVPSSVYNAVNPLAMTMGVPAALWEYVVYQESSFNPTIISSDGSSYGLFQLDVNGGQGATALQVLTNHSSPWTTQERALLLNSGNNARFGLPPVASAWNKYKATFANTQEWWIKFCADSGHPGGSGSDPVTLSYVRTIMANYHQQLFGSVDGSIPVGLIPGQGTQTKGLPVLIPATTPGKKAWYKFPRIDNIGGKEPFGGFPKPDSNIQIPAMYPVTALLPGTVTAIDHGVAWGAVITMQFDNPPTTNPNAKYCAYLHLNSIAKGINVGTHVYSSQIIAYNGSSAAEGAQKVPLGFALYAGPHYGQGTAWSTTQASITTMYNPVTLLNNAAQGKLPGLVDPETGGLSTADSGTPGGTGDTTGTGGNGGGSDFGGTTSGGGQTYTTVLAQVHSTLTNNPGFYGMALAVDESEQFPGWIDLTDTYDVGPFKIPDPVGVIRSTGATIVDNFIPFFIRSSIFSLGAILLVLLLFKAVMDSGMLDDAAQVGMMVM